MSETTPVVSVIVPVYNVVEFLPKCVETILSQNFEDIELILVDDGSTDGSGLLCDSIASSDSRVRVIHKSNAGVSAARNVGLDASRGEWVCFVDGDDWVLPDYVGYLLELAEWGGGPIATMRRVSTDFDTSQLVHEVRELWTGEQAVLATLRYCLPIGCYARIFSRDYLNGKGVRFFEDLRVGEGFNFNCLAFQYSEKVAVGNRRLYHYRKNNANSVTTKFNVDKWQNGIEAIDRIKDETIFESREFEKSWEYAWWRTNSDAYDLVVLSHSEKECPEFYRKVLGVTRSRWISAFRVPISAKDRIRAIVMGICPRAVPWAMIQRRKHHQVEVETQR
jgi:glycosyltransferase involved in cell wall biosynthesis